MICSIFMDFILHILYYCCINKTFFFIFILLFNIIYYQNLKNYNSLKIINIIIVTNCNKNKIWRGEIIKIIKSIIITYIILFILLLYISLIILTVLYYYIIYILYIIYHILFIIYIISSKYQLIHKFADKHFFVFICFYFYNVML